MYHHNWMPITATEAWRPQRHQTRHSGFKYWLYVIGLLWLSLSFHSAAAVDSVVAQVDKNPVMMGESFQLEVIANGGANSNAFDSSPLLRDFTVGGTSVSTQTQIINGSFSKATTWTTTLFPKREGQFTIPAITVEGHTTQPIRLLVVPVSQSANAPGQDLYMEASVDTESVYVQQQFLYSIKIFVAMDFQRASLTIPEAEDAEIQQFGNDSETSQIINGKRYRVIERRFSVVPQTSGPLRITSPRLEIEVADRSRRSFGGFGRSKTERRIAMPVEMTIKSVPAGSAGTWLPSESVQLHEQWQPQSGEYVIGEPVTRTLTLTARGVQEQQLPEISSQYPDNIKVYPDQATTTSVQQHDRIVSQRTEKIAIVPNEIGEITLPEVKVPWFNLVTEKTEYATLPSRTIKVIAAPNQPVEPVQFTAEPAVPSAPDAGSTSTVLTTLPVAALSWWSWSSWVLLALWLATLLLWWLSRNKTAAPKHKPPVPEAQKEALLWKTLQKALKTHDASIIQGPLQAWLAAHCGHPEQSLARSQAQLQTPALNQAIAALFSSVYGPSGKGNWRSDSLADIVTDIRQQQSLATQQQKQSLQTLYPQTS